jgi:hypothetical protein
MTRGQETELWNLYHLARTALCGKLDRYGQRMDANRAHRAWWAAEHLNAKYPEIRKKDAYLVIRP